MHIKDNLINFLYDNYIRIAGNNLFITKMLSKEILIKGKISNIGFNYE